MMQKLYVILRPTMDEKKINEIYGPGNSIEKYHLCILYEVLLRHYRTVSDSQQHYSMWFLTLEESISPLGGYKNIAHLPGMN
jgi:hypothetical protein